MRAVLEGLFRVSCWIGRENRILSVARAAEQRL